MSYSVHTVIFGYPISFVGDLLESTLPVDDAYGLCQRRQSDSNQRKGFPGTDSGRISSGKNDFRMDNKAAAAGPFAAVPAGKYHDNVLYPQHCLGFIGWLFGWVMSGGFSVLLFFIILFSLGGAVLPYIYIRSEAKKANLLRKKEVLPLVQQLKVLSRSGVGTSFNALAGIVVEDATGVLMKDIQEAVEDISRGKGRKEALLEMAEKTGSPVVKEVMEVILDAEEKELPLYGVLESIETRLLLDIETRADEIKSKDEDALALPLAGLILPANMILMVAPGIIGIKSMMTF